MVTKNIYFTFFLFFCCITLLQAQGIVSTPDTEIIYEERFNTPGFPNGWSSNDVSNQDILWTWCADPTTGQMDGCPRIWSGGSNNQLPFAASSADDGFLTLDSDAYSSISNPHISQLTTAPFNFLGESTVWISFQTHIGVFNITPNNNALFRVSSDNGVTWTNYNCFPEFGLEVGTIENRWSENPKTLYFNLSEVAAQQSSVIFQWQWIGQGEYQWSIDDVETSSDDPRPTDDLVLDKDGLLIPENAIIPITEITPIPLGAGFRNQGSGAQANVKLAINIRQTPANELVFTDTVIVGPLGIDEIISAEVGSMTFTPPAQVGTYLGTYEIIPDQLDHSPENNVRDFSFEISDFTLAKERLAFPQRNTAPLNQAWLPGQPHTWAWGNHFFIRNGFGKIATNVSFSIANGVVLAGKIIQVSIYEWSDLDQSQTVESTERNLVGFHEYTITGEEPGDVFITVPVTNLLGEPMELKDQQAYLVMVEYLATDAQNLFINYSSQRDYAGNIALFASSGTPSYASVLGVGFPLDQVDYTTIAFGYDRIPLVRLHLDGFVNVRESPLATYNLRVFPNPAGERLTVQLNAPDILRAVQWEMRNGLGQLVKSGKENNFGNSFFINANDLISGVYYLIIKTKLGNQGRSFFVGR